MKTEFELLENFLQQLVKFAIKDEKNYTKGIRINLFSKGKGIIHLEFTGGGAYTKSSYGFDKDNMICVSSGHHYSSIGSLVNKLEHLKITNFSIQSIENFDINNE